MLAARRLCLGSSLLVLGILGCNADPLLSPEFAAANGSVLAPSNVTATAISASQIDVAWRDNSSNEAGFEVWVAATGLSPFSLWTTTGPNVTSKSFTGINPGQEYCAKVRAFTTLGQSGKVRSYSDFSNTACATTPPPAGPSKIAARPLSSSYVEITWSNDIAFLNLGFRVERSIDQGTSWTTLVKTDQFTTRTLDFGRSAESPQLCYRVIALTQFGESTPSKVACTTPPAAPTNLVAAGVAGPAIVLSWTDNSNVEDGYQVLRAPDEVTFSAVADLPASATSYRDVAVSGDKRYWYQVVAKKDGGFSSSSNTANAVAATAPPSAPSGADAVPAGSSAITVTWINNATNEDGFRIERSADGQMTWQLAGTASASTTWFADASRTSDQQMCYRVFAFNGLGASSASNIDCATPPAAPTGLVATTAAGLVIDLTWIDNSKVEDGYEVQRLVTYCDYYDCYSYYVPIATLGPNATSYHDAGLNPAEYDTYVVFARKDGGYSDASNEAAAWSDFPPAAPSNLSATAISPGQIDLAWTNNSSNAELFDIERCVGDALACGDAGFVQIAWAAGTATTFHDTGLPSGATYTYRIRTYVGGRYSDPSNVATATTP